MVFRSGLFRSSRKDRRALRQGPPSHRSAAAWLWPLCPARQQFSHLRLCLVLGQSACRRGSARRQLRKAVVITVEPGAFRDSLDDGGRLAGLDVGVKTIGIALCDAGWPNASTAETIRRTKFSKDMAALSPRRKRGM